MIIYGTKTVHVKSVQSTVLSCPNCGTQGSLMLSVYRRHFHIFWIPIFPIGKKGFSQCGHCKNVLETKEMTEPIRKEYDILKSDAKGPIWQYAGLLTIAIFIVWANYISAKGKKIDENYINAPLKGDVYEYKVENGSYSTLKVISVSNDSVFVSPNEYEITKKSKIYKIDKSENYSKMSYGISREKIKEMFNSGEIFDVNR